MNASITDLRYRMRDVLRALERNEQVCIVSRGKVKGVIKPPNGRPQMMVQDHPFFGMQKGPEAVEQRMDRLCGGRYRD